jgi:DNA-binding transcriptional ArsR family regulator
MFNLMVESVDAVFGALAHPIRRELVSRLSRKEMTVSDLAARYPVSLNAISKHLKVLEAAGLVSRRWEGRTSWVRLEPSALAPAREWINHYRDFWDERLDALERVLDADSDAEDA